MNNQTLRRMTQKVWKCRYIIGITLVLVVGVHTLSNPEKPISNPKTTLIVLVGGLIASTRLQLQSSRGT